MTGTEGFAELRLSGDPFVDKEAMLLCTTNSNQPERIKLADAAVSITEDFLNRIAGQSTLLTHDDIMAATLATIEADEQIQIIHIKEGVRV